MNNNEKVLVNLLSSAIRNKKFYMDKVDTKIDWQLIFESAKAHQVYTLIFPIINSIKEVYEIDKNLVSQWKYMTLIVATHMVSTNQRVNEIILGMQKENINVMALKGIVLNKCYPKPELRTMGDVDLLVQKKDFQRAENLLNNLGYIGQKDKGTKHVVYIIPNSISIEVHRKLLEKKFLLNEKKFDEDVWKDAIEIEFNNIKTLAMSWEMQVIYTCIHMASHYISGGFGLRQLCDLVVITESKRDSINWIEVKNKSIEYGIEKFVGVIFEVCKKLLDLETPDVLKISYLKNEDNEVDKFINDIFLSGTFGKNDKERMSANLILKNSNDINKNKLVKVLQILFPSREKLSERYKYMYIRKYPILIPIAWIHRLIYGIKRKDIDWNFKTAVLNSDKLIDIAHERTAILKWLDLKS